LIQGDPHAGTDAKPPLLISSLIDHAQRHLGDGEIVSRRVEGDIHRTTWAKVACRSRQVAQALDDAAIDTGARVATLAWNGYRHLELYYGVSCSGRILHTLNPRLQTEQLAWIINHAEDSVVCFDTTFTPLALAVQAKCPSVKLWVALCEADQLPHETWPNVVSYEGWIARHPHDYVWPVLDENTASSLCYTSGTTGMPKGVLYSHRSSVLHSLAATMPDALNLSARDCVLPVVPMFHVNAWGIPYASAAAGSKLVFPGPSMDGPSIHHLMETEGVTMAAGVPTVWQMLLTHMQNAGLNFSTLNRTVIGGSACPPAMLTTFEEIYGVEVLHAWGMTEMSPLGTVCTLKNKQLKMSTGDQLKVRLKQGKAIFGVDMKIVDSHGEELPWDGKTSGDLLVRGPWIMDSYIKSEESPLVKGWFPTGDVATIDADGYMQITDRSKDVIKSGGEWISSIDVENIAMSHPAVAMAACVGIPHPKWDERPIVVVVLKSEHALSREELLDFYVGRIAKWQIPDDVVFLPSIPLGATGKMQKMSLRLQLQNHELPNEKH